MILSFQCGYESARTDIYLDIPLVIRPFGSSTSYSSVEQALQAFVEPEILDGNNQYFCERCGKKCNAHKVMFLLEDYMCECDLWVCGCVCECVWCVSVCVCGYVCVCVCVCVSKNEIFSLLPLS